jgi:general L-amino acid transport system permease protein
MSDISYVRTETIPQREPPLGERGIVKWLRENLFSSVTNGLLTIVSILVIAWLLKAIVPWFYWSIWSTSSVDECRVIRDTVNGGHEGACFSVVTERWRQILFGFYPPELYWRAILNFILLFVALAPVLYSNLPRKMLWFTMIYPFLMVWLVWGGSIWVPVSALLGFVIGYLAFRILTPTAGSLVAAIAAFVAPIIWWLFLGSSLAGIASNILPINIQAVESRDLGGLMISVIIGVSGIALSLPLGVLLALGRQSNLLIIKTICVGFIEFIRGVPLITLLFTALILLNYFLPPGVNFDFVLRVIIMVTLFSAAYMAETIRGGLAALPRGQYEAADSLGLDYWQAQRLIIMPQALKVSIPGIVNNFIGLFKDTTLVTFIGIFDMLGLTRAIRATTEWQGIYYELYIFVGLIFFVCCFSMGRYSQWLERRLRTDRH